ncbi:phage major capsid protein [Xanthobacter versatilis]|uniref:phage major capsid protein n=1 Tax=Xanthobacter autotrophicus (strain ATCC BAA-1158 / Py2) TaxID=78245 RepID=UPI0037271394
MAGENDVLEQIQREVKGFGDNVSGLKSSMEKDLADVRKLAEEAKKSADRPEVKAQIDALTTSVSEKHAAIEKTVAELKAQADQVATAMRRAPLGDPKEQGEEQKHALAYFETKAAAAGSLKVGSPIDPAGLDMDGYRAWSKSFPLYLRRDDKPIEAKALSVGSDPNGGYLVPTAVSARILTRVWETSPLRQLSTVETIGTDKIEIPIDDDEASAGWVGETEGRPETGTPAIGVQTIPVFEIYAKPRATQSMLEDASINIEGWLATKISDKFARIEASAFIVGNGVKKPRGILTYPAAPAGTYARGKILQVNSGHATNITADGLVNMTFSLKEAYLANGSWLMKRGTVGSVALLKDAQGQYLWRPGLEAGKPSILLGYPVRQADDMPVVGAGALPIAFGDFRAGYTVVDRLGITTLRDPYSAKPFVEFYSRRRVGGDVTNFEAFALMVVSA